jgi:hypothetical protein
MSDLENMSEADRDRLASFANRLLSDPETSKKVRRIAKEKDPTFQAPDIELEDRLSATETASSTRIKELEEKIQLDQLDRKRAAEHQKIRDAGEDPEYIEKIMTEKRVGSYDTALFIAQKEREMSAASVPGGANRFELPSGEESKDLWKNPAKAARDLAHKTIDEFKKQNFRQ